MCKPADWESHLAHFDRVIAAVSDFHNFAVQINVDWRPLGVPIGHVVREANERFGNRLRSIVTYWDPAHNFDELLGLGQLLVDFQTTTYVRMLMRSAESVRTFRCIIERWKKLLGEQIVPLLGVDALSPKQLRQLENELSRVELRTGYQVTHETPASHFEIVDPSRITTVQLAIGSSANIEATGSITLDEGMVVKGCYNLFEYLETYRRIAPTASYVVMGPTRPDWSETENESRLRLMCSLLTRRSSGAPAQKPLGDCASRSELQLYPPPSGSNSLAKPTPLITIPLPI